MYAVIQTGGKQYRVEPGDVFPVEKLDAEPGQKIELDTVLLLSDGRSLKVGTPYLDAVRVFATAVENGRSKKVITFKYKAKKDYRKKRGHRQHYTLIEIESFAENGKEIARKPAAPAKPKAEAAESADAKEAAVEKAEDAEKKPVKRTAKPKAESADAKEAAVEKAEVAEKKPVKRTAKPKTESADAKETATEKAEGAEKKPVKRAAKPKTETAEGADAKEAAPAKAVKTEKPKAEKKPAAEKDVKSDDKADTE